MESEAIASEPEEEVIDDEEVEKEEPAPTQMLIVVGNIPLTPLDQDFPSVEILDADVGSYHDGWTFSAKESNIFPDAGYAHNNNYSSTAIRRLFSKDYKEVVAKKQNGSSATLQTEVGYLSQSGSFKNQSILAREGNDFISERDTSPSFAPNGAFTFARHRDQSEKYSKIYRVPLGYSVASDVTPNAEPEYGYMYAGESQILPTTKSSGRIASDDGKFSCKNAIDVSLQGMCLQIRYDLFTNEGKRLLIKPAVPQATPPSDFTWDDASDLLPADSNRVISSAVFSPDGEWIVFAAGKPVVGGKPESYDLFKISTNGGEPKKLSGSLSKDQVLVGWTTK